LALALVAAGSSSEAVEALELDDRRNSDPVTLSILSAALLESGRGEEALQRARAAVALEPNLAMARGALGWALLHVGSSGAALESFSTAVHLEPDNPNFHAGLASALTAENRFRQAMEHFEWVLATQPAYLECERVKGYFDRAKRSLQH
jgi:tetratricopeptide (TPR) repeat protein